PFHQVALVVRVAFLMPLLDHGGGVVKLYQAVGHAARQPLAGFQAAADGEQGHVGHQGKGGRETAQLAVVFLDVTLAWCAFQPAFAQAQNEGTQGIAGGVGQVAVEDAVELLRRFVRSEERRVGKECGSRRRRRRERRRERGQGGGGQSWA